MEVDTKVIGSGTLTLEKYALITGRTFKDTMIRAAKGVTRHVIRITPPFQADGKPDSPHSAAKVRGYMAIERDLAKIFSPVRIKGKRKERISGAQMVGIHLSHLKGKRPGKAVRRDRPEPYFVDRRKYMTLLNKLRSHVGRLAAGWMPAVAATGATGTPGWVSRHGGRGDARLNLDGSEMFFEATNYPKVLPANIAAELQRRVPYALQYQMNDRRRELERFLLRDATKAGLTVA